MESGIKKVRASRRYFCVAGIVFSLCCVLGLLFGRTALTQRLPEGSLSCPVVTRQPYRSPESATVYLVTPECTKRPFFNPAVYLSFFADWTSVVFLEQWEMDRIPDDPLRFMPWGPRRTFENGSLVKITSDPRVYLLADGRRYPFESEALFLGLGYSFDQVEDVAEAVLNTFAPQGAITEPRDIPAPFVFKYANSPDVYVLIREGDTLVKSHILSMDDLRAIARADRIAVLPVGITFPDGADTGTPPAPSGSGDLISLNVTESAAISGVFSLDAATLNATSVSSVRYLIGNTDIGSVTSSLDAISIDTTRFANGSYTLTAIVTAADGTVSTVSRVITVNNPSYAGYGGGSGGGGGGSSSSASTAADTTAPVVSAFTIPSSSTSSFTIAISSFTATDNVAVTGYNVSETSTAPLAGDEGWTSTAPTTYAFTAEGSYTLYAWAKDAAGNVSAYASATTTVSDEIAPVITVVASSTSVTSATIAWTTDEAATSTVEYGTDTSYGSSSSSVALETSHSVVIESLTADTLYHFRVSSQDAYGNVATSTDYTFRTEVAPDTDAPVITVVASSTSVTSATIAWTTDEAATSTVEYGTDTSYGSSSSSVALETSHSRRRTPLSSRA